ncbi:hypothetical protein GGI04_001041 [Coemansia thaxteri]|nr:hypothetical protein GGI04_001041 [Coemansia thaxteri]
MKHGKQAAAPAPAHALPPGSDAAAAAATTTAEPCLSSPAPLGGPSADLSGLLDMWWDHVLLFFIRHRACAALAVWLAVFLFDVMDLHMPAEWLIFTLFSFSVFVHAFAMSVLLFAALTSAMTVLNIAVFYLLPFSITSLFSTLVVCMLLVRGLHGLDLKGWAVTALMALARLNTPWCETLPNYLQAPIAAYCTSFGFLWLAYHNARRLERLVDPVCLLLGAAPPPPPRIHLVEICHTSIAIAWRTSSSTASVAQPTLTSAHGHYSTNSSQPPISTVPDFPSLGDTAAPSARTLRYEIEANGHIVGNCAPTAAHARIQGLIPTCLYQVRVWAISHNHARSSSLPVFVTTLSARDSEACDDTDSNSKSAAEPALVSANLLRSEIEDSRRTIHGLQVSISDLKASADDERSHLQEEISGLRSKRKDEESLQAAQRDKIRHLESEKRRLDKERLRLDKDITDALARKQRALDRLREQERQVQAYVRDTKSIEADMERERRDHQQQQAELRTTIATLKSEIDKAKQKMASLSVQQTELSDMLKAKRIALAEQEKKNADSINEPGTRGFARQLSPADFWSESVVSPTSLSTTMAEASALSILRDTDLAYPTPERPGCRTVGQRTVVWGRQESLAPLPPPTASLPPVFGGSNVAARLPGVYHHPLNRVLTSSTDRLDLHDGFGAPGETPHGRFSSLDLRTAAGGWPEPDYTSQSRGLNGDGNLSGRSSTTNDRRASPCPDMGAFLLRSATPVEPPPLRLSGDMLPIHRPHIEPIGAPVRRRVGGPPSPKAPTRGSSHPISQPPLSPAVQPPPPVAGQYPPGLPISREMSHPSSFGHSLYYKRSLWDLDVAVDSAVTERAKPVSLQSNKAPGNSGGARQHR